MRRDRGSRDEASRQLLSIRLPLGKEGEPLAVIDVEKDLRVAGGQPVTLTARLRRRASRAFEGPVYFSLARIAVMRFFWSSGAMPSAFW